MRLQQLMSAATILLACTTLAIGQECSSEQKRQLEDFFKGRRVTAKIDLPLVNFPGGLWVFWNGEYNLAHYAESFTLGPASIRKGQSSAIKKIRFRGKEIFYEVGGAGLHANWKGPYEMSPDQAYKHGCLVHVAFGRNLTASDCSVETSLRALSGVLEIAGVAAAPVEPPAPVAEVVAQHAAVELISIEVVPTRVSPGAAIRLVTHLSVAGGPEVEVTELRQIYFAGKGLFRQPRSSTATWTPGVHRSNFEFQVPDVASPGIYRYKVIVKALGKEQEKETLFEIQ